MTTDTNVKTEIVQSAAERIAQVRHAWGWKFQQKHPRAMEIDFLMAEAAFDDGTAIEEIMRRVSSAGIPKPNIVPRETWDAMIAERDRLQAQMNRYKLPTQRGAKKKAEEALYENNRKIRAVDGVIGIDA